MSLMVWVEIYQRWELSGLSHVIGMGSDSRSNLIKAFETEVWSSVPQDPPDWQEILTNWRGSELQNYFTRILEDDLQAIIKPQYVDNIPKAVRWATSLQLDKRSKAVSAISERLVSVGTG